MVGEPWNGVTNRTGAAVADEMTHVKPLHLPLGTLAVKGTPFWSSAGGGGDGGVPGGLEAPPRVAVIEKAVSVAPTTPTT